MDLEIASLAALLMRRSSDHVHFNDFKVFDQKGKRAKWELQISSAERLLGNMQEASCGWVTSVAIAATPALFLVKEPACHHMLLPWFGILPLQVSFHCQSRSALADTLGSWSCHVDLIV